MKTQYLTSNGPRLISDITQVFHYGHLVLVSLKIHIRVSPKSFIWLLGLINVWLDQRN